MQFPWLQSKVHRQFGAILYDIPCLVSEFLAKPAEGGAPTLQRTVNVWRFAVLAYFLVCGGPFGIEIAVTAGGPLPTLLAFFVMPLLWSIPQVTPRNRHPHGLVCPSSFKRHFLLRPFDRRR